MLDKMSRDTVVLRYMIKPSCIFILHQQIIHITYVCTWYANHNLNKTQQNREHIVWYAR